MAETLQEVKMKNGRHMAERLPRHAFSPPTPVAARASPGHVRFAPGSDGD
jgi:hypothetical protein